MPCQAITLADRLHSLLDNHNFEFLDASPSYLHVNFPKPSTASLDPPFPPAPTATRILTMASLRNVAITAALLAVSNSPVVAYPAPVAADGWSYCLVATDLTKPRGILFDTEGGLIAVDSGVGLVHFSLKDGDNDCLTVNEKKTLVANKDVGSHQWNVRLFM